MTTPDGGGDDGGSASGSGAASRAIAARSEPRRDRGGERPTAAAAAAAPTRDACRSRTFWTTRPTSEFGDLGPADEPAPASGSGGGGGGGGRGGRAAAGGEAAAAAAASAGADRRGTVTEPERASAARASTRVCASSPRRCPSLRSVTRRLLGRQSARATSPTRDRGASHFLEHLLFKGTDDRTRARDRRGGRVGRRRDERLHRAGAHGVLRARARRRSSTLALDILADVVWQPAFRADEVEAERQVILEEIRMRDDTPDDLVHDAVRRGAVPRPPARPRGARQPSRRSRRWPATRSPRSTPRTTDPANVVVAAAGNLDHDDVRRACSSRGYAPRSTAGVARRAAPADGARPASRRGRRPADRAGPPGPRHARRSTATTPTGTRSPCSTRSSAAACRPGCSRRSARSAASRTPCTRTGPRTTTPARSAVYAGTAPERVDEMLDVVERRARRLVADGGITDRRARRAPRATSRARWRCRSRARRAACTASAAAS